MDGPTVLETHVERDGQPKMKKDLNDRLSEFYIQQNKY